MPGLVDTHHHLTQSFGKALVFGEPSEIFRRVWVPLEGSLDEESVYLAAKLAALESLRGGFTTVCEAGTRMEPDVGVVADATAGRGHPLRARHDLQRPAAGRRAPSRTTP